MASAGACVETFIDTDIAGRRMMAVLRRRPQVDVHAGISAEATQIRISRRNSTGTPFSIMVNNFENFRAGFSTMPGQETKKQACRGILRYRVSLQQGRKRSKK